MALELEEYKPQKQKEVHQRLRCKQFDETVDFGFCPVQTTTSKIFELFNPNNYQIEFEFQAETVHIYPEKGVISAKSKIQVTISFTPEEAVAITCQIIMKATEEEPRIIKLSAAGKYPYISLNMQQVDFDQLLVNKKMVKQIEIKNSSQVTAKFNIYKIQDDEFKDNSFEIDIHYGDIQPKETQKISVTYKPQISNLISVAHYKIQCQGGNDVIFECTGYSTGFQAKLSTTSINFGEVKIESETSRLLTIHNDSDLPFLFEFYNDPNNVFGFSRLNGQVNPKSHERIIVHFRPRHTICYYERVYCIVRNHSLLYVDLIGTCYDLLIQPIPLLQKHIDAFRRRVILGKLTEIDFKYMENAMLLKASQSFSPDKKLDASSISVGDDLKYDKMKDQVQNNQKSNVIQNNSSLIKQMYSNQIVLHKEMMQNPNSENKLIVLSEEFLDFDFCEYQGPIVTKDLVLHNRMSCKITIFWTIQTRESVDQQLLPVFNVYPETASLKPNSSMTFQVQFRPVKSNYYFFQQLQFFAFKYSAKLTKKIIQDAQKASKQSDNVALDNTKVNQTIGGTSKKGTSDLTADETIPPYTSSLRCVGHSFGDGSQPYIPILKYYPSDHVFFAACSREESLYQTVELHNLSDTPSYFKFSPDLSKTFKVYPKCGLVEGKGFVILTIEFNPKEFIAYNVVLNCYSNHNASNSLKLNVHGYCSEPNIELQNNGKVYFPPSYTGVCSRQKVKVQNMSRIPLQYDVQISKKYRDELYIEPSNGNIKPNETIFLDCSFIPYKKKNYKIKVPLVVREIIDPNQNLIGYHLPGSGNTDKPLRQRQGKEVNYSFEIFGQGGDGSLEIESVEKTKVIDFGIVKVNFNKKQYAILHNYSNCTFYIELSLRPNLTQFNDLTESQEDNVLKNFTLDFDKGIIAANSTIDVGIMFNPTEVGEHNLVLDVVAKEKNPMIQTETKWTQKLLVQKCKLQVKGTGSYPLLKIADVRNDTVSVATLWENFQINKINDELAQDLNEDEKTFLNIETLNYTDAQDLQNRLKSYNWNFGYLPSKSNIKPRKIVITLENTGGTECDWQFKLPSDNQIDVEPWADPGEPTEEDAYEKAIIEKNIFQINPKSGTLQPKQLKDVELVYSPGNSDDNLILNRKNKKSSKDEHILRVVFQILNGKPLVINLKGMTLAPMEGRLAVKKNKYDLPDTPIGLLIPVKFPIEIQNVGALKINYKIEIEEKDKDKQPINSKFQIFEIQNRSGQLLQNERQYLYCQFKPLEAKSYYHTLKIKYFDFMNLIDELVLDIEGRGYSKQAPQKKLGQEVIPKQRSFVSTIGSKVFFSIEEIDFGTVVPLKSAHRLIILYNLSKTNKLNFDFSSTNIAISSTSGLTCGDTFEIMPSNGQIEPGSFIELKLTLLASTEPSEYQGEMECSITWDQRDDDKEQQIKQASNVSQPTSTLNPERETLFLRIKKKSSFDVELINSFKETTQQVPHKNKHAFETIFENVINDILNDTSTIKVLKRIDDQPQLLAASFDGEKTACLENIEQGLIEDNKKVFQQKNYKDYRQLFLEDEFIGLVDEIMENTFFNIISETTRGECDLLRISKTFVMPNK